MENSWDSYYMELAKFISTPSTCDRLNVGCVLVKDNEIIATGYNDSISGHSTCNDEGHLMIEGECKRTIHSELHAILYCASVGVSCKGAIAYVTHQPCPDCTKHLNQVGIKRVIFNDTYEHRYTNQFHEGMTIEQYN